MASYMSILSQCFLVKEYRVKYIIENYQKTRRILKVEREKVTLQYMGFISMNVIETRIGCTKEHKIEKCQERIICKSYKLK